MPQRMHSCFWRKEYTTQSAGVIAAAYRDCMNRNANRPLNLAPDNTGRLPEEAVASMAQVAKQIRR